MGLLDEMPNARRVFKPDHHQGRGMMQKVYIPHHTRVRSVIPVDGERTRRDAQLFSHQLGSLVLSQDCKAVRGEAGFLYRPRAGFPVA